jgi:hypothetical protein
MRIDPLKKTVADAVDKWADRVNAEFLLEPRAVATLVELIMAELKAAGCHPGRSGSVARNGMSRRAQQGLLSPRRLRGGARA